MYEHDRMRLSWKNSDPVPCSLRLSGLRRWNTSAFEEGLGHDSPGSILGVEEIGVHAVFNKFINRELKI